MKPLRGLAKQALSHLSYGPVKANIRHHRAAFSPIPCARGETPVRGQIGQPVAVQLTVSPALPALKCEVTVPIALPRLRKAPVTVSVP